MKSSRLAENVPLALQSYVGRMVIGGRVTKPKSVPDFAELAKTTDKNRAFPESDKAGSLPLDSRRLEELRRLIGEGELAPLKGMADVCVPLLLGTDPPAGAVYEGPYSPAQVNAGVHAYTALTDAARGRSLLLTGSSEAAMREADVVLSRLAALPKKNPRGQPRGISGHWPTCGS